MPRVVAYDQHLTKGAVVPAVVYMSGPAPLDAYSPGDIASHVKNISCKRPVLDRPVFVGGVQNGEVIAQHGFCQIEGEVLLVFFRADACPL